MSATVTISLEEFDRMREQIKQLDSEKYTIYKDIKTVYGKEYFEVSAQARQIEASENMRIAHDLVTGRHL